MIIDVSLLKAGVKVRLTRQPDPWLGLKLGDLFVVSTVIEHVDAFGTLGWVILLDTNMAFCQSGFHDDDVFEFGPHSYYTEFVARHFDIEP